MPRYLVTGAAGFVGSHVVERLLSGGALVVGLDNLDDGYPLALKMRNLASSLLCDRFRLVEGDIRDRNALHALFEPGQFDAVVHLAARAGVRPSLEDPQLYNDVNVRGTTEVLEAVRRFNVPHLVYASSSSVYGETSKVPFNESQAADRPSSPYAATKRASEISCYVHHHLYGLTVNCLRFFTVYGPRQRPEMAVHKFARLIDAGESVPIFGDGLSTRDYTYIEDIVNGVDAAILYRNGYNIFNLGATSLTPLIDLAEGLARRLQKPLHPFFLPNQAGDVPTTYADITLAGAILGYSPNVGIEEGLDRFVEWYARLSAGLTED